MNWDCGVPGKKDVRSFMLNLQTNWAGGLYKLKLTFPDDFPQAPPKVYFSPAIFHPNVFPSGALCLSITNAEKGWKPSITLKQILLGVQELLDTPNCGDPANAEASTLYQKQRQKYQEKVREQARRFATDV
jgi:ubiquitin-conjugating enzyme E2 I